MFFGSSISHRPLPETGTLLGAVLLKIVTLAWRIPFPRGRKTTLTLVDPPGARFAVGRVTR
jgi:hypothetical protein